MRGRGMAFSNDNNGPTLNTKTTAGLSDRADQAIAVVVKGP